MTAPITSITDLIVLYARQGIDFGRSSMRKVLQAMGLVRAYIDETGDRGHSGFSSRFFAFAAVLAADEDEPALRQAITRLRHDLSVPQGKALHWKDHAKTYERRQHVARTLAEVAGITVVYAIVEKAAIPTSYTMYSDHELFYNFAACITMERILKTARDWPGGVRDVVTTFGHVKGFNHESTTAFFARKAATPRGVPWERLHGKPRFASQHQWDGLQAADQYAGMLNVAIRADRFGGYEEHHLLRIRHQIRKGGDNRAWGRGFKVIGSPETFTSLPWWPADGL